MAILGKASKSQIQTVSQTKIFGIQLIVIISQHCASSVSILCSPKVVNTFAIFQFLFTQSLPITVTWVPSFTLPSYTRQIQSLPR
jgi:hypothetical protein